MKAVLVILAALLALLHPWLILAAELAFIAAMGTAIARSAGVPFRIPPMEVLVTGSIRRPRARRSEQAAPAPGVVRVRLAGDTVGADVLAHILRGHPAVEILTGPDRYDDGRQYLTVRVRMDGSTGHDGPEAAKRHHAGACWCGDMHLCADAAALYDVPEPRLLPAPCDRYEPAEAYGPCVTCGRTLQAHRIAAAAAAALWPDDDNDGSNS